jgi:hypothetical protein
MCSQYPRIFLIILFVFIQTACPSSFLTNEALTVGNVATPTPVAEAPQDPYSVPKDPNKVDITDPSDLQVFIDRQESVDTATIWERLGIDDQFNGLQGWDKPKSFLTVCNYCQADIYRFDLDERPGDEMLLRVASGLEECRYLLFKEDGVNQNSLPKYRLIGTVDHSFGRYEMPEHYFVVGGGRVFLAVKVQTQSGSGVAMYVDRLFTVVKDRLVEVLDFPHRGHQEMWWNHLTMGREFNGRVADIRRFGDSYTIEIGLNVAYDKWDNVSVPMWTKKQKATYRWSVGTKGAVLVPELSTVSNRELESVYEVDDLSDNEFENFNRQEIRKYRKLK